LQTYKAILIFLCLGDTKLRDWPIVDWKIVQIGLRLPWDLPSDPWVLP